MGSAAKAGMVAKEMATKATACMNRMRGMGASRVTEDKEQGRCDIGPWQLTASLAGASYGGRIRHPKTLSERAHHVLRVRHGVEDVSRRFLEPQLRIQALRGFHRRQRVQEHARVTG